MSSELPLDPLAVQASRDTQRQAARLAQEAFAAAYRLSAETDERERIVAALSRLAVHLDEWIGMASQDETHVRRALLMAGLDQWGLAYAQAFGPQTLAGVSLLISLLRDELSVQDEALCQRHFDAVVHGETVAWEFKIELRRALHMALWHSMIASEDREEAFAILRQLGSMMRALTEDMPNHGWRLVSDAVALVQIRCLGQGLASEGLARETTTELFGALAQSLPDHVRQRVMSSAAEAVHAWQQAQREARH